MISNFWERITDLPIPRSRWTPFAGMEVQGKLKRVVLRGELVLVDGKVLAPPGFGQDVRTWKEKAITIKIPGHHHICNGFIITPTPRDHEVEFILHIDK